MTKVVYKDQAKRLAEHLSRVHGVKLKSASMLEAVACMYGRPDWNTLLACGPAETTVACPGRASSGAPPSPLPDSKPVAGSRSQPMTLFLGWLTEARVANASSLDIRPSDQGYEVFVRIEGIRRRHHAGSLAEYDSVRSALYATAGVDADEAQKSSVVRKELEFGELKVKLVSDSIRDSARAHLFIRWTEPTPRYCNLEELGLSKIGDWAQGISRPSGVCLVAGATGSGRTSTIVATARTLVAQGRRVVIISEDIDPRWVPGAEFGHRYREPGDVLILGQLREAHSAEFAFDCAGYGTLVVAAIHSSSAQGAISRLRDLGVTDNAIDSLVNIVLAQQLTRSTCSQCEGKGCASCQDSGYSRRLPICEIISAFPGRPVTKQQRGKDWPMPNMLDDAVEKFRKSLVAKDELVRCFGPEVEALLNR